MSYVVTRIIRPEACTKVSQDIRLVETYDAGVVTDQDNGVGSIPFAGMFHFSGAHGLAKEDSTCRSILSYGVRPSRRKMR